MHKIYGHSFIWPDYDVDTFLKNVHSQGFRTFTFARLPPKGKDRELWVPRALSISSSTHFPSTAMCHGANANANANSNEIIVVCIRRPIIMRDLKVQYKIACQVSHIRKSSCFVRRLFHCSGIKKFNFIHLHSINWTWGQCFLFFSFPLQIMLLIFSPFEVLIGRIKHVMNTFTLWLTKFDWFRNEKKANQTVIMLLQFGFHNALSFDVRFSRSTACFVKFMHGPKLVNSLLCTKLAQNSSIN